MRVVLRSTWRDNEDAEIITESRQYYLQTSGPACFPFPDKHHIYSYRTYSIYSVLESTVLRYKKTRIPGFLQSAKHFILTDQPLYFDNNVDGRCGHTCTVTTSYTHIRYMMSIERKLMEAAWEKEPQGSRSHPFLLSETKRNKLHLIR